MVNKNVQLCSQRFYYDYDGFVILHGTDTTAYGGSVLSFMLESVGKTVVITGAQVRIKLYAYHVLQYWYSSLTKILSSANI